MKKLLGILVVGLVNERRKYQRLARRTNVFLTSSFFSYLIYNIFLIILKILKKSYI
jgi:hypothetical protein